MNRKNINIVNTLFKREIGQPYKNSFILTRLGKDFGRVIVLKCNDYLISQSPNHNKLKKGQFWGCP